MATYTDQSEAEVKTETECDKSIKTLQEILACEQLEPVTYEEAKALGYDLMTFFEMFSGQDDTEDKSNGNT